ncbi:hypothetical protein P692DRAFT_20828916, partial [Suillus brevipes Sb2]
MPSIKLLLHPNFAHPHRIPIYRQYFISPTSGLVNSILMTLRNSSYDDLSAHISDPCTTINIHRQQEQLGWLFFFGSLVHNWQAG